MLGVGCKLLLVAPRLHSTKYYGKEIVRRGLGAQQSRAETHTVKPKP